MSRESPLYVARIECPVCRNENAFEGIKVGSFTEAGRDTDFCPTGRVWRNSEFQKINPLAYAMAKLYKREKTLTVIGGPHAKAFPHDCQRFFDLWSKGTLRTEMRRLNQLTDKFEFNEQRRDGRITVVDGFVRMANILPATLVATIVTTIAGYVSYVRSIWNAGKDLRAGKEIGDEADYDDLDVAFRTSRRGARHGRRWLSRLAAWGGGLYAAYLVISAFWKGALWSAIWHGFLYGTLGWPAGWLAGLLLGAVIGFGVGLVIWLARQLAKAPPAKS